MITAMLALLANAATPSIVDAERHFAALAQEIGQWRAFERTAAAEAVILIPQPVPALEWLKGKADPPRSANWQPAAAYLSCDGSTGATIGPWQRPTSVGYFATVWSRETGEWRWKVDMGDVLKTAWEIPPAEPKVRKASCARAKPARLPAAANLKSASGWSRDHSLQWSWESDKGTARLVVMLWNGRSYERVIDKVLTN